MGQYQRTEMSREGKLKESKCKSLCIEIGMWNMKCKIIPIITGAKGIATNGLKESLEAIPGKYSIDSLQNTAIPEKSHIIQKVLMFERRGSPLVQEKYQAETACDKKQQHQHQQQQYNNNNNNLFSVMTMTICNLVLKTVRST
jgi:hypothetical protein